MEHARQLLIPGIFSLIGGPTFKLFLIGTLFLFFSKPEQIEKLSVWFPWENKVELTSEAGLTGKGFIVECPTTENTWPRGKLGFAFSIYSNDKLEPATTVKTEIDKNPTGFTLPYNFDSYLSATHKFTHSWDFDLSDIKPSPERRFNIQNGFLVIGVPELGIALRRIELGASKWTFSAFPVTNTLALEPLFL